MSILLQEVLTYNQVTKNFAVTLEKHLIIIDANRGAFLQKILIDVIKVIKLNVKIKY